VKHKIYIGDHPTIENYIDGIKIKPEDTRFGSKGILVFNRVPRNINKYLKYSVHPIYILLNSTKGIPYKLYKKFEIIQDKNVWDVKRFVEHIFYNPNRKFVFDTLCEHNPNSVVLFEWIRKNVLMVYDTIPEVLYKIDEQVIKKMGNMYFYSLISFGLESSGNVINLKWVK